MAAAALTPRIRTIVICDDIAVSLTDDDVLTLEGVRLGLETSVLPCRVALNVYLLLSSPRGGRFDGKLMIVNERTGRAVRYVKYTATIRGINQLLPLTIDVGECLFPEAGQYSFEFFFAARDSGEALKGEHPFFINYVED